MRRRIHLFVLVALAAALVLSACGGSGGDEAPATKAASDPAGTSEPAVSLGSKSSAGAVSSVDDVKSATVQILADGTYSCARGFHPGRELVWLGLHH